MKIRLTLTNSAGCELEAVETDVAVRDGQFSAGQVLWKMAPWELQHGDIIRVTIPGMEGEE
jgi:hypothetical protein